jgi:hypothetical protein
MINSRFYLPIKIQRFYEIHCVFADGSVKGVRKNILFYTFEENREEIQTFPLH